MGLYEIHCSEVTWAFVLPAEDQRVTLPMPEALAPLDLGGPHPMPGR